MAEKEPVEEAEAVPACREHNQTEQGHTDLCVVTVVHTIQTYKMSALWDLDTDIKELFAGMKRLHSFLF